MERQNVLAVSIGYLLLHVLMDAGSFVQPVLKLGITPWNPQIGLVMAFLCVQRKGFAWVVAAQILAELLVRGIPSSAWVLLLQSLAVAGIYQVAANLIRAVDLSMTQPTLAALLRFFAIAGTAAFAVSVVIVGLYSFAGVLPQQDFSSAVGKVWVGDLNGMLMLTPLILNFRQIPQVFAGFVAAPGKAVAVTATLLIAFALVFFVGDPGDLRFFYILFVPAILAALAGGVTGVLLMTLAIQIGLVVGVQRLPEVAPLVDLQYLMLTLAGTALALGVVVAERGNNATLALQREMQLRDREASLARASRAATAGELASVIAHELNQPMTALVGYLRSIEIMLASVPTVELRLPTTVRKAAEEALRVSDTLHRLRNFYAGRDPQIEPIDLRSLLHGIADLMQRRDRVGVAKIETLVDDQFPMISADPVLLSVIIANLISNAADAVRGSKPPTIVIEATIADGEVRIAVDDNGDGVPERLVPELFKAFVTLKPDGMGMGLAASQSLAQALGGSLMYRPSHLGGASFVLILPMSKNGSETHA